jgi:insertion element IS1 protein InsB
MSDRPYCPCCRCTVVVKSGFHRGKQRWVCRRCGYQFTVTTARSDTQETKKLSAVLLYGHGCSFRTVARLLGTCAHSVLRWVCDFVDTVCAKPVPGTVVVIVVDEMWHYLSCKANKLWIWTAIDRETGRLVDWECGGRDATTFVQLLKRLKRWGVRLFCTDDYVVYESELAIGQHYQGKDMTVQAERTHSCLRHWLARFRRRTCVVSRSKDMVDRSIALFAYLHVDGRDRPERHRLQLAERPS